MTDTTFPQPPPPHPSGDEPRYSVNAYGATGDGVTNDATAIQAAITACQRTGGVVELPPGTYLINSTLNVTADGVTLQGSGSAATVLKATAALSGLPVIQLGNGTDTIADCNIRDLMIDSVGQKTGSAGIDVRLGFRTRLEHLRTMHQYHSIHVHNSTETWVTACDLRDQSADGIQFDNDLGLGFDLYINNVAADNPDVENSGNGLNWSGGENLVVQNCDFLNFATGLNITPGEGRQCRWGFFTDAEFDTASDNCWKLSNANGDVTGITFVNCWAGTATNYGVLIDGGGGGGVMGGIRLSACKIIHNGLAGVRLIAGATQVSINDCDIISNSQASSNTRSGIEVTGGATGFLIEGCQINNGLDQGSTQSNGINFDSGATDYFMIIGNNLNGNDNAAIAGLDGVTGTHAKAAYNVGADDWPS